MADFAGLAASTAQQTAIGNYASAEARSHCEEDHVARSLPCSKPVLGDRTRIGIVI